MQVVFPGPIRLSRSKGSSILMRWFRGNLHTHTTNSDGDSPPEVVVAWYRDAGYDFLALTDHDFLTLPEDHAATAGPMLLVHGEEVTAGDVHLNALGIRNAVLPLVGEDTGETLQLNVDAIRATGGLPSVNHPNYRWRIGPAELGALDHCSLFEVYNGGPETNDFGGAGHPSHEALWDAVLTAGRRLYAIAVDDAHHFLAFGRSYANPGRGWVWVRAERPTEPALLGALEAGDVYASTGVELHDISVSGADLAIDVVPQSDLAYRTTFIGDGGHVLETVEGVEPRFRRPPGLRYVRARVDDSDGQSAWVQPVFEGGLLTGR